MSRAWAESRSVQLTTCRVHLHSLLAVLVIPLLQFLALGALAQDRVVGQTHLPDSVLLDGQTLHLNGAGLRTLLGFRVYVAGLYLPRSMQHPNQVLQESTLRRLQIILLRDAATEHNLDALKGGLIDNNTPAELDAIKAEIDQFLALLRQVREVHKGTVIQIDYLPGRGTRLIVDQQELGTVPGERFNRALLKIWLGEDPIQLGLKRALLGQKNT